jgi:L-asparaginase II
MDRYAPLAEVTRSGFTESRHFGSLVGLDARGEVAFALGDAGGAVLPRSTSKPLQAAGSLGAGARVAEERLAIAAGSHTGEERHVAAVLRVLADAGLTADALQCPPSWPEDEPTMAALIRAGAGPARILHNCSGKHAAMLSACVASGWSTDDYLAPEHPVQLRIRQTMERLAGERIAHVAVDGCGAPTLGLTVVGLARAMRAIAIADGDSPESAVAAAMRAHPEFVGGTGHPNTALMLAIPGVIAKGGAEGVFAVATADGRAVAMKIIDGSARACTLIALSALAALGVDTTPADALATVPMLGGGKPVGVIRATLTI